MVESSQPSPRNQKPSVFPERRKGSPEPNPSSRATSTRGLRRAWSRLGRPARGPAWGGDMEFLAGTVRGSRLHLEA